MRSIFSLSLGALLLAACATPHPPRMANVWRDAAQVSVPCKRVLVIGYGEDGAERRIFEDTMVDMLGRTGVAAFPAYAQAALPEKDAADPVKQMRVVKADCLLSTKLLRTEPRTEVIEWPVMPTMGYGYGYRRYGYYGGMGMWGPWGGWPTPPPTINNYTVHVLESSLRREGSDRLVWSGGREMLAATDPRPRMAVYAEAVARGLREAGFL